MSNDRIQVLLVDDHPVVRAGLRALLVAEHDMEVVGEAGDGPEAIAEARLLSPDVVVVDLSMPDIDGVEVVRAIAKSSVAKILVIAAPDADDEMLRAFDAGATGFVHKGDSEEELVRAVRAVSRGERFVRAGVEAALRDEILSRGASDLQLYEKLTSRERSVARMVGQGYSAPEIGARLAISPKTVDTYKQRIQQKLEFTHRSQYVQFGLRLGLLTPD